MVRRIAGVKRVDKRRMEERREEAGEELAKVGWTCGKNGRGTVDEESGCARKETEMGREIWWCVENEGEEWGSRDSSETGSVTKRKKKNRRPASVPASPGLEG